MGEYQNTFSQLQGLLGSLEKDNVSIDELTERLNKGFELLDQLRTQLTATQTKVTEIIAVRMGEQ